MIPCNYGTKRFKTVSVPETELYVVITEGVSKRLSEGKIQKWPERLLRSLIKTLVSVVR
jgi:hypothetical protein